MNRTTSYNSAVIQPAVLNPYERKPPNENHS